MGFIKFYHLVKDLHVMGRNFLDMWTQFLGQLVKKIFGLLLNHCYITMISNCEFLRTKVPVYVFLICLIYNSTIHLGV